MSNKNSLDLENVNLVELINNIWNNKIVILFITLGSFFISTLFYFQKTNNYEISSKIHASQRSNFIKYTALNEIIAESKFVLSNEAKDNVYLLNNNTVFDMFFKNLSDYEKIFNTLEKNEQVNKILNINENKIIYLETLAESFYNTAISDKKNISIIWHDVEEAKKLLEISMNVFLYDLKKSISTDINELADAIDARNKKKLELINIDILNMIEAEEDTINKKMFYLKEQLSIARELGLVDEKINERLKGSYYSKGSKAIEKEIEVLQKRVPKDGIILIDGYIQKKSEVNRILSDISSKHLRNQIKVLDNDDPRRWVIFSTSFVEVKSLNRSYLFTAFFSIIIGLVISLAIVLIKNIIQSLRKI